MARIPRFQSSTVIQGGSGNATVDPRAYADAGGGMKRLAAAMGQISESLIKERVHREVTDMEVAFQRDLMDFETSLQGDTSFETYESRLVEFTTGWAPGNASAAASEAFRGRRAEIELAARGRVRQSARRGQIDYGRSHLSATLQEYEAQLSGASDRVQMGDIVISVERALDGAVASGLLGFTEAEEQKQGFRRYADVTAIERELRDNPGGLLSDLEEGVYANVTGKTRETYIGKAQEQIDKVARAEAARDIAILEDEIIRLEYGAEIEPSFSASEIVALYPDDPETGLRVSRQYQSAIAYNRVFIEAQSLPPLELVALVDRERADVANANLNPRQEIRQVEALEALARERAAGGASFTDAENYALDVVDQAIFALSQGVEVDVPDEVFGALAGRPELAAQARAEYQSALEAYGVTVGVGGMSGTERAAVVDVMRRDVAAAVLDPNLNARAEQAELDNFLAAQSLTPEGRAMVDLVEENITALGADPSFEYTVTEDEIREALGNVPGLADSLISTLASTRELISSTGSLIFKSPEELSELEEKYRADVLSAVTDPYRSAEAENAELNAYLKAIKDARKALLDNPAAVVMQSPHLANAATAFRDAIETGDSNAVQAAADELLPAMEAEYVRLGVPSSEWRYLTDEYRASVVAQFNDRRDGGESAGDAMAAMQETYGRWFPVVLAEIQGDLPDAAVVIASLSGREQSGARRDLASIADMKTADIPIPTSERAKDYRDKAREELAPLLDRLQATGGLPLYSKFESEVARLAMFRAATNGISMSDAVERAAYEVVYSQYHPVVSDGIWIPITVSDPDGIRDRARRIQEDIGFGGMPIDIPNDLVPSDDPRLRRSYGVVIMRQSSWVPTETEDGIRLVFPGGEPVRTVDGRLVEILF